MKQAKCEPTFTMSPLSSLSARYRWFPTVEVCRSSSHCIYPAGKEDSYHSEVFDRRVDSSCPSICEHIVVRVRQTWVFDQILEVAVRTAAPSLCTISTGKDDNGVKSYDVCIGELSRSWVNSLCSETWKRILLDQSRSGGEHV